LKHSADVAEPIFLALSVLDRLMSWHVFEGHQLLIGQGDGAAAEY
jgi:hypothetical protein